MVSVLTANRLRDGHVVYLTEDSAWSESISAAKRLLSDEEKARAEHQGEESVKAQQVVGAELILLTEKDEQNTPDKLRERIRAIGPTVRPDLSRAI